MTFRKMTREQLQKEPEALRRRPPAAGKHSVRNRRSIESLPDREGAIQAIVDNLLPGMVYQVVRKADGKRVFTYLSDKVRLFYGITPEEGLADPGLIYGRVHPGDRERVSLEEEEAHRTLSPFRSEVRMLGPEGGIRWSLFVSNPRRLDDGSTCWDGIEFDITEFKKTEKALRESEERFAKIFRTSPDAISIARLSDGNYIDVNDSFTKVSGYSREELIGHSPLPGDLNLWIRREDRDPFAEALRDTGEALGLEIQFRRKDGEMRTGLLSARTLDMEGEACHVSIVRDITDRRRADAALRESLERHRIVVQTAMDGFWMMDMQGRLLEVNETYRRMSGYSQKELLRMNVSDLDVNETETEIAAHILEIKAQGEVRFETRHRRKDGSIYDVEVSSKFRPTEGGRFEAFLRDITDRKKAEKAIKKSEGSLRALAARLQTIREEERADISREIHDDLGQLLTSLKLDLSWFVRHPDAPRTELGNKVEAMGRLIDRTLRTVRRISTELRPRILDDFGLIAALEWQAGEFTHKTGIPCLLRSKIRQLTLDPALSTAVFRIFQEALTNVARHSGANRVDASLRKDTKGLTLKVRDNGKGIPLEAVAQSHSLGLVGMQERALIFGGTVEVTGLKGKGTMVTLRVPFSE